MFWILFSCTCTYFIDYWTKRSSTLCSVQEPIQCDERRRGRPYEPRYSKLRVSCVCHHSQENHTPAERTTWHLCARSPLTKPADSKLRNKLPQAVQIHWQNSLREYRCPLNSMQSKASLWRPKRIQQCSWSPARIDERVEAPSTCSQ